MWRWHKKSRLEEVVEKLEKTEEKIYEARDIARKSFFKTRDRFYKFKKGVKAKFSKMYNGFKNFFKR